MKFNNSKLLVSPRDLIAELECSHRLHLEWATLKGLIPEPEKVKNEELDLLIKLGKAHEANLANQFAAKKGFRKIPSTFEDNELMENAFQKTLEAMRDGAETIYTPTLFDGEFVGYPDFLIRARSAEGEPLKDQQNRFIYDPVDAKSARSEKRAAVLQVAAYAFAMEKMGLPRPNKVHLWLANDREWSTNASDLMDLGELFYNRTVERIVGFQDIPTPDWDAPREACTRCRWEKHCEKGRREFDDLSLIQGIRSTTRLALVSAGIKTVSDMANASDDLRAAGNKEIAEETFENLRSQADIQLRGRTNQEGIPIFEVKDEIGFGLIPMPSLGDVWFDMEGDPYAENGEGLEYMFGYVLREGGEFKFRTFDAENREQEKSAFGEFIEFLNSRRAEFPEMHVYHYASYEPTALLRLAQRHGYLEYEVDKLIREGVFVDLYSIVRKTLRFSTESLSIKKIEPVFYEGNRDKKVSSSIGSVVAFEDALTELKKGNRKAFESILNEIKEYNEDDCRSTQRLDQWLRDQASLTTLTLLKQKSPQKRSGRTTRKPPKNR